MTSNERAKLLERIGYGGEGSVDPQTLRDVVRAWVHAVPFENLDIHLGIPIQLESHSIYRKVVEQRRGGFCYEVNSLIADLLESMGFDVALMAARVFDAEGIAGRDFHHLLPIVTIGGQRWLAEVGFGDWSTEPLSLEASVEPGKDEGHYRLRHEEGRWIAERRSLGSDWKGCYCFTTEPRALEEFSAMCLDLQTSETSYFRNHVICTIVTDDGRYTLSDDRLIKTNAQGRSEQQIRTEEELSAVLDSRFGIALSREQINRLWSRLHGRV